MNPAEESVVFAGFFDRSEKDCLSSDISRDKNSYFRSLFPADIGGKVAHKDLVSPNTLMTVIAKIHVGGGKSVWSGIHQIRGVHFAPIYAINAPQGPEIWGQIFAKN